MPRKLYTEHRKSGPAHQQAQRWTLVLAVLSIVCATAEAWWMSMPGV